MTSSCPFCGSNLVERPRMAHRTTKFSKPNGKPAVEDWSRPYRRWFCPACKRVVRGEA